jgi:ribosomal protein S18 acetylase RimI-like enzyme
MQIFWGDKMKTIIREATIDDVYGIAKVHVDTWNSTYANIVPNEYLQDRTYKSQEERWLKRLFKNEYTKEILYVAVTLDGEVVGFICGSSKNEDMEFKGTISTIYISESYQRQGIGKQLVKVIVEKLHRDEVEKLIIWALEENQFCKFYEKIGGKQTLKKTVNMGGRELIEIGFTWTNLKQLLSELK